MPSPFPACPAGSDLALGVASAGIQPAVLHPDIAQLVPCLDLL